MKLLDAPIRLAAGRTLREVMLIGLGVGSVVTAIAIGDHSWNVYVYALSTVLFAMRFFAGRVLYLSLCVGALALQLSCWMLPGVDLARQAPVFLQILGIALLLSGGDLVQRFDDGGRGLGPLRNYWRELSVGQRRHIAWGMHLVGATGGILHHMWFNLEQVHRPVPGWLYLGVAACSVVGILYLWGRAIAAPAAVVLGGLIAWKFAPHLGTAWRQLDGVYPDPTRVPSELYYSAHYTVSGFVVAVLTALIAVPWAARWLRLPLR